MKNTITTALAFVGLISIIFITSAYTNYEKKSMFEVGKKYKTINNVEFEFKILETPVNNWTKVESTNSFGKTKVYYMNLNRYDKILDASIE